MHVGYPQTDRNLESAFEKPLHDQPWHAADDRQIRNQGRQLRPELGHLLVRQRRQRDRAAVRALTAMAAIFGDVRRDRRQLRHLMPARIPESMPRVQAARAVATRLRGKVHDRIHALDGHQRPMVARMARLPARFASTPRATPPPPLVTREAIGGRRLGRDGGILLLQRELALEISNALRILLKEFPQPLILLAQPFDVLRRAITRVARWLAPSRLLLAPSRHRRERTKTLQKVQVLNRAEGQRA